MDWKDKLHEAIDFLASEVLLDAPISEVHKVLHATPHGKISLSFSVHRDVGNISEHLDVILSTRTPEIRIRGIMATLSISGAKTRGATLGDAVNAVVAFERDLGHNAWCHGTIECMLLSRFPKSTVINYPGFSVGVYQDKQVKGAYEVVVYGDGYSLTLIGAYGDYMRPIDVIESFRKHVKPLFA